MHRLIASAALLSTLWFCAAARAAPLVIESPAQQEALLELYTSEGCSSCPPADAWFSQLTRDPGLWRTLVPVAFHVDYWDHLGWRDRYADARFSQRQYAYRQLGYVSGVYTPGVLLNGREFRGWNRGRLPREEAPHTAGVLKAVLDQGGLRAEFQPAAARSAPLTLNLALLGFEQTTRVGAGENGGRVLRHDFVALALHQYPLQRRDAVWQMQAALGQQPAPGTAVALWVTAGNDPTPLQAAGGWLK